MPEPITIIAGVTTIVGNVWKISQNVYELIDGIENAPKNILAISKDVRGLYAVLGSLQGLLQDLKVEHLPGSVVAIFEGLQQPLDHCFWAFRELQAKIHKYIKPTGDIKKSKWSAFWWQFTEKDMKLYRDHLASYKLTVDVALATANLANTSQTVAATHALTDQLQAMHLQLDRLEQQEEDDPELSIDAENGSQATDRQFALRRFLETAETVFTGSPPTSPQQNPALVLELGREAPLDLSPSPTSAETNSNLQKYMWMGGRSDARPGRTGGAPAVDDELAGMRGGLGREDDYQSTNHEPESFIQGAEDGDNDILTDIIQRLRTEPQIPNPKSSDFRPGSLEEFILEEKAQLDRNWERFLELGYLDGGVAISTRHVRWLEQGKPLPGANTSR